MTIATKPKTFHILVILGGIWLLALCPSYAQNNPGISANPFLKNDSLELEIHFSNLFTGSIKKTLLAGLPILLEVNLDLLDSDDHSIHSKKINGRISYDVWEELFKVEGFNSDEKTFQSLGEVQDCFSNELKADLVPKEYLMSAEVYRVDVESQLTLLTRKQSRELEDWIRSSDQTEEDLPTQERDTGFRLNLNKVVQFFVGKGDEQERYNFDASSKQFRLSDLTKR
jgi:hypothetical protein